MKANISHKDISIHIVSKYKSPMFYSELIDLVIKHEAESRFGVFDLNENDIKKIKDIILVIDNII